MISHISTPVAPLQSKQGLKKFIETQFFRNMVNHLSFVLTGSNHKLVHACMFTFWKGTNTTVNNKEKKRTVENKIRAESTKGTRSQFCTMPAQHPGTPQQASPSLQLR